MTEIDKPMVTRNPKTASPSPEKFPSAALLWRVGMMLLVCVALFVGCAPGDPKSVEALENIQHPDEAFRLNGLSTLSRMGDKAKPHADKVAALLKDTSSEVRSLAVTLLGVWGHSSPEVVQEVSAMAAGDEDAEARSSALSTLSMLGANDEFAKVVKGILAGDDADLKSETLVMIVESGKESVTAVKAELEAIAGGSDDGLAADAKEALKTLEE